MNSLSDAPFVQKVKETPWKYSFLHLCRWIEARTAPSPRIGEDAHPFNESVRLGQTPSTAFAAREIADIQQRHGRLRIRLFGLGLYGPNGPLPLHLTEEAHERTIQKNDTTLTDFLDMFHHRWLALFYRAWAMGQPAAGLDRPDSERFSRYIASLIGHDPSDDARAPIPSHARLAAVSHLVSRSRYPAGLAATFSHFWNLRFRVEEYPFHWLELDKEELFRLGTRSCRLGQGAVLGTHIPDRQSLFILHLGPLHLKEYERFLPTGADLPVLRAWVREFVGVEMDWMLSLSLLAPEVPRACLDGSGQLGRSTWLARKPSEAPVQGKLFSPEKSLRRTEM